MTAALIGAMVGVVVGMTSTGGGALLTPALILVLGVAPSRAIGSDLAIAAAMKLSGAAAYAWRREVHWGVAWRLACGSLPGALVGLLVLNAFPDGSLEPLLARTLGGVLLAAGVATWVRFVWGNGSRWQGPMPSTAKTVVLGFVVGILVTLTSVGSGSLLLVVLTFFFPLGAATIVGTDLVHACVLSAVAAVGHHAAGRVDPALAWAVLAGAIPGVLAGARLASRVPERALRQLLAGVLVVIGLHLLTIERPRAVGHTIAVAAEEARP